MEADKIFLENLIFAFTPQRFWLNNCGYFTYLNARDRLPDTLILAYFSSKYQRFWLIFIKNFTYFDMPDPCRTYSCLLFKKVSAFLIDFSWRQDCQYGINKLVEPEYYWSFVVCKPYGLRIEEELLSMMRYTELAWRLFASQVNFLTFQLTTKIRLLPVSAWPSHDGKEGGNSKS